MAQLTLYGASVADSVLVNACDMASASGGAEVGVLTTLASAAGNFGEVLSQGGSGITGPVTSIPTTPTGHGWVFSPGDGTFDLGNWSASITLSCNVVPASVNWHLRFFKYSSGTYSLIGTILSPITATAKTTYTFAATSMPATTFIAGDLLYVDLWWEDGTGASADSFTVYVSTSATAGVTDDMQVTTSNFTPTVAPGTDPTIYGTVAADATLATACDMVSTLGGTETSKTTIITGSSFYAEIWSKGNAGLTSVAAIPSTPTGNGWIYHPGAGTFLAANWSASIALSANFTGTLAGDITLRFFKYTGGVYTAIGQTVLTSPAMSPTRTVYGFPPAAMPAVITTASDFIYIDLWFHDTGGANNDNPVVYVSASATQGVASDMQVTTANFAPPGGGTPIGRRPRWVMRAITGGIFTPFQPVQAWVERALTAPFVRPTQPYTIGRYIRRSLTSLLLNYQLDIPTRFRLRSADQLRDIATRFILGSSAQSLRDIASRFRLRSTDQLKDIVTRLRLMSASQLKDVASRFRLRSVDQLKDTSTRFRLRSADQLKDIQARLRLRSADQLKDIASRFRQRSADQLRNIASRFRLRSADQLKDITSRLRLRSADQAKDVKARLKLRSADQLKDIASRLRLRSANQLKDIQARFWLVLGTNKKDISTRFRQRSADQLKDISTRFILVSVFQRLKDVTTRFRQRSADRLSDIKVRLRLRSADQAKDVSTRFRQMSAYQPRDVTSRLRLMSASRLKDISTRLVQISSPQPRDITGRLVLVIFQVRSRDICTRLVLSEKIIGSTIIVSAPRGQVEVGAPRGTLCAVAARGAITVEEE